MGYVPPTYEEFTNPSPRVIAKWKRETLILQLATVLMLALGLVVIGVLWFLW